MKNTIKNTMKGVILATAVAGLFTACGSSTEPVDKSLTVKCAGINDCKGQGGCEGEGHQCKGLNACKGKGWIEVSKEKCSSEGGSEVK